MRAIFLILLVFLSACTGSKITEQASVAQSTSFSYSNYDLLLTKYVVNGRVRYKKWIENRQDVELLEKFLRELGDVDTEKLSKDEQKAFWINAYNAFTLASVLKKYPIKSVNYDSVTDPKVKNFWDTPYRVAQKNYTLNQIENSVLRPTFKDPRIHFAINCASLGCPALQSTAWKASSLDMMLDEATRGYLSESKHGLSWDRESGKLKLSSIFNWYAEDFVDLTGFINRYNNSIKTDKVTIEYLNYDWTLNSIE